MALTAAQIEKRRTGIGSSEAPAVAGLDRYRGPHDIYALKVGEAPEFEGNDRTKLGEHLEDPLARHYAWKQGIPADRIVTPDTLEHPEHSWALASCDRLVLENGKPSRIVEVKSTVVGDDWGAEGTDQIPERVLGQVAWQLMVTGIPVADVVALVRGVFLVYQVTRDAELERLVFEPNRALWFDHIQKRVPPPIDGSDSAARYLKARYPEGNGSYREVTPQLQALFDSYVHARKAREAAEEAENEVKNLLVAEIGPTDGIAGLVTYRNVKPATVTDWAAVAKEMGVPADLIVKHTKVKDGYRRFLPRMPKEK
jgi:putative phage-type endonuclease